MEACRAGIESLLRRDLAGWAGLPAGCGEAGVEAWLRLTPGEGVVQLGSERVEYRFRVAPAAGFTEPVRLHFLSSELRLLRTGLWPASRAECERLLGALGEAPDRFDLAFGGRVIPGAEWVYAGQGLALGVLADTGLIASVSAFAPCGADTYLRLFHSAEPVREFPGRR